MACSVIRLPVFRRSNGSAVVDFVLVAGPLCFCFAMALIITFLGYEKSLTNLAATTIAERITLADVEPGDAESIVQGILNDLGLEAAEVAISDVAGLRRVAVQKQAFEFFSLESVSFGVNERQ